jgi:hypothetical protein
MMKRIGIGMLAGLAGTAALTAMVQLERKVLPLGQKNNATFQRKVIKKAGHLFGIPGRLSRPAETAATHASSFAYGTAMGSLYGWWASKADTSPWVTGPAYGLFLWGIGLAGWLPAFGIERVPWKKSPVHAAMPIVSHLVYGLAAAAVLRIVEERERAERRDRFVSV